MTCEDQDKSLFGPPVPSIVSGTSLHFSGKTNQDLTADSNRLGGQGRVTVDTDLTLALE